MSKKHQEDQVISLKRKDKHTNAINDSTSVDLLNLPPRSKAIQKKEDERRPWWKLKYPLLTALVFLFILLPIGVVVLVQSKYEGIFSEKGIFIPSNKFEKVKITTTGEDTNEESNPEKQITNDEKNQTSNNTVNNENKHNESSNKTLGIKKINHVVKDGETLFTISMKYYGNRNGEEIIQDENNLTDINLKPGQVLKIPLNIDANK